MTKYEHLRPWADTVPQHELLDALANSPTVKDAGDSLGTSERVVYDRLARIKRRAAEGGIAPEHGINHSLPDTLKLKGTSTLVDGDGNAKLTWYKSGARDISRGMLLDAMADVVDAACGKAKPIKAPKVKDKDLLAEYIIGDPHIGLYCFKDEVGEDFDLKIARRELLGASQVLIDSSPKCERAVITNLGDFFHADNVMAQTMRSGHKLDVDSRWSHVLQVGCTMMVDMINLALHKHRQVEVINCIGNHDDHSSVMLAMYLEAWFKDEKRVKIISNIDKFSYYQHGKCLVGATHGDTVKPEALPSVMANDQSQAWGECPYRYWRVGHFHNSKQIKSEPWGVPVEYFRTLAPRDWYAHSHGYRSGRDMTMIEMHREYGETGRRTCDVRRARG